MSTVFPDNRNAGTTASTHKHTQCCTHPSNPWKPLDEANVFVAHMGDSTKQIYLYNNSFIPRYLILDLLQHISPSNNFTWSKLLLLVIKTNQLCVQHTWPGSSKRQASAVESSASHFMSRKPIAKTWALPKQLATTELASLPLWRILQRWFVIQEQSFHVLKGNGWSTNDLCKLRISWSHCFQPPLTE